jgi:hypothetical protein
MRTTALRSRTPFVDGAGGATTCTTTMLASSRQPASAAARISALLRRRARYETAAHAQAAHRSACP